LVTGFLGAGKTTLVNQVLRSRKHVRAAVYVNEYGAADVDGEFLRWQGKIDRRRVLTIEDGCMCCGGKDDLRTVLAEELGTDQARSELDVLIVETSGVCDPRPVLGTLAEAHGVYLDSVVVVFDATTVGDASFGASEDAQRQLKCADVLMLSKADLLAHEAAAGAAEKQLLELYRKSTGDARPEPRLIRKAIGQVMLEDLCEFPLCGEGQRCSPRERPIEEVKEGIHSEFATHAFCVGKPLDRERFETWAAAPPKGLVRAKGMLWVQGEPTGMVWHLAGGRSSGLHAVEGQTKPQLSELVFIGNYGDEWNPYDIEESIRQCIAS
jgi:G3E family GTPase